MLCIPFFWQRPSLQCSLGAQLVSTVHGLITGEVVVVVVLLVALGAIVVVGIVNRSSIFIVVPGLVGNSVGQVLGMVVASVASGVSLDVSSRVVFILGVVVRLPPVSLLTIVVVVITGRGVGVSVILFSPSL